jgi:hypothetical protein
MWLGTIWTNMIGNLLGQFEHIQTIPWNMLGTIWELLRNGEHVWWGLLKYNVKF